MQSLRRYSATVRALGELQRRRLSNRVVHALSPRMADDVAAAFRALDHAPTVDLAVLGSPAPVPAFERHELYGPAVDVVPPVSSVLPEMGRWSPPINAYRMAGVELDVDSGLVFSANGVIEQSTSPRMAHAADLAAVTGATRRIRSAPRLRLDRPVAPMGEAALTYYHLFVEVTARALQLASVNPQILLLTSDDLAPIARTLLDRTGLDYEVLPAGTVVTAPEVWFCDRPTDRNWPRRGDFDALLEAFRPPRESRHDRALKLYVSRSHVTRSLVDEHLLEKHLAERGFVVAHLEDLPLDDQFALFADADLVIGPHGAGLTNIIFMKPGGRVIELATERYWTRAFPRIAAMSQLDYDLLLLPPGDHDGRADDAIEALETSGALSP